MQRLALTFLLALISVSASASASAQEELRGFTADDLVRLDRISSPVVSPDGQSIVYALRVTDMDANKGLTDLWIMPAGGGDARRLTTDPTGASSPVWAPDGRAIYFLSKRGGKSQVWRVAPSGGEAAVVSDLPLDLANLMIAPDGKSLLFSMQVFTDCADPECTAARLAAKPAASGVTYDRVFVRHWDTWNDGRRQHLFRGELRDGSLVHPVDLMPGMDADAPSMPWGGVGEVAFAPGGGVVFTARAVGASEPWSTNFDLFYVSRPGVAPVNLTAANEAWDTTPVFAPDGKSMAWLAMSEPGYEADRYRILIAPFAGGKLGVAREVAPNWDRSAQTLAFSSDGTALITDANHLGHHGLFAVEVATGTVTELFVDGSVADEVVHGGKVYFSRSSFTAPADLWSVDLDGTHSVQLTALNEARLAGIDLGAAEQFTFTGAHGDEVHGWIVYPANFDPALRYPVAFLIHGGPQGSFGSNFHYRWNPQTFTGAGYAVVTVDFHGSTGYGKKFCDSIQNNWGGWPLEDLQKGLAAALKQYPWMDSDHVAALGGSYGGYMINWIEGNWSDRFTCLVNHDGLFDTKFMAYSTEELWFPIREFGGMPFANPDGYDRWNPAEHVASWKTPMLVIHGQKDQRVPLTQGLATFNALQYRGIPSRLLYFPDENHWVLKPHNSVQWHTEVLKWLDQWTKGDGGARQG